MDKKYQIYISSTYEDLREERNKVRDAILSMYHFPVGMEMFGAANEGQWEIIRETIENSDYYVLIIGHRYGTIIPNGPDKGISYTEKEYRYAKEKGIPILAFLIDEFVPVKAAYVENKHIKEFEKFKADVKRGRTVTWWKNADDLAQKVISALYKQIERTPRQGWIAEKIDIDKYEALKENLDLHKQVQMLRDEQKKLIDKYNELVNDYDDVQAMNDIFMYVMSNCRKALFDFYGRKISQEQFAELLREYLLTSPFKDR
ncbi:DUF4062 domain-containing protein [Clostridiales bacterium FE2011]|nr:DUF4062 domain-containing protein [Clostridiales bacterium FE2011]